MSNALQIVSLAQENPAADLDVKSIRLLDDGWGPNLASRLMDAELTRSMEESSSIKLVFDDYDRSLVRSDLFSYGARLRLNNLEFSLVGVSKDGDQLTITFEDYVIWMLRRQQGYKRSYRGQVTRAEFIFMLLRELPIRVPFYCPQLHDTQPVKPTSLTKTQRKQLKKPGGGATRSLTVEGRPIAPSQVRIAQTIIDVGIQLDVPYRVLWASIVCAMNESRLSNPKHGDLAGPDSRGVFQQRAAWGPLSVRQDPAGASRLFFKAAVDRYHAFPTASIPQLVVLTQFPGLASLTAANTLSYQGKTIVSLEERWVKEAKAILDAWGLSDKKGTIQADGSRTVLAEQKFAFERQKNEDSWTCMKRLAEEVNWLIFMHDGVLYFISADELITSEPQMVFRETDDGIDNVDFNSDTGYRAREATVQCHANRWQAPPGTVAVLDDLGPHAAGRWLVNEVHRPSLFQRDTEVSLIRKSPALLEPAPEVQSVTTSANRNNQLLAAMEKIDRQNRKYGPGGHGPAFATFENRPGVPLDCSSSVSLALWMAGLWEDNSNVARVSGQFNTWGRSGKGKTFTIWYHSGHVWIELHGSGWDGFDRFDTSPHGSGGSGPHLRRGDRSHSGFAARHWPGL